VASQVQARISFVQLAIPCMIHFLMEEIQTTPLFVEGRSKHSAVFHKIRVRLIRNLDSGSVIVTVVDRCEGCQEYDLDFSPTAFDALAPESEGRYIPTKYG
jgi:Lytic transglycolase